VNLKFCKSGDLLIVAASEWIAAQKLLAAGDEARAEQLAKSSSEKAMRALSDKSFHMLALAIHDHNSLVRQQELGDGDLYGDMQDDLYRQSNGDGAGEVEDINDLSDPTAEEMNIDAEGSHHIDPLSTAQVEECDEHDDNAGEEDDGGVVASFHIQDMGIDPTFDSEANPQHSTRQGDRPVGGPSEIKTEDDYEPSPDDTAIADAFSRMRSIPADSQSMLSDEPGRNTGGPTPSMLARVERLNASVRVASVVSKLLAGENDNEDEPEFKIVDKHQNPPKRSVDPCNGTKVEDARAELAAIRRRRRARKPKPTISERSQAARDAAAGRRH